MTETTEILVDGEDDYAEHFIAPEGFAVRDEETANWVIRKITEARARATRMREMKKRADAEIKAAEKSEAFFIERFGAQLEAFARPQIEGARAKSTKLLEGTIGFRKSAETLKVFDEDQLIEWADQMKLSEKILRFKPSIDKAALMHEFRESGEMPDGCVYQPETEVLYVR